jgi:nitrite reductase/ring-hydroxylating ferredoxin subunit/DMSO/TMAO reductase YedYZ heme-binding membrane subunit
MTIAFRPVGWNRNKLVYDAVLAVAVVAYIGVFILVAPLFQTVTLPVDGAVTRMMAFGTCAFLMLTVILSIGPLVRLDPRFLPLLYNRRHFGVMTATVAFMHLDAVLGWYYAFSPTPPAVALLAANTSFGSLPGFPFELFGLFALVVLAVLAATSHDFWLAFLGPPLWKAIHMSIYAAYAALVAHVAFGALQDARNPLLAMMVGASVALVAGLHLAAARKGAVKPDPIAADAWVDAGEALTIPEGRARVVRFDDGSTAAIFRYKDRLSALSNVCSHQNGPVGEGCAIAGRATCPWHGFQYRLEDGVSPPPFTERIATYGLKLAGGRVLIDPHPNPLGTRVEPLPLPQPEPGA